MIHSLFNILNLRKKDQLANSKLDSLVSKLPSRKRKRCVSLHWVCCLKTACWQCLKKVFSPTKITFDSLCAVVELHNLVNLLCWLDIVGGNLLNGACRFLGKQTFTFDMAKTSSNCFWTSINMSMALVFSSSPSAISLLLSMILRAFSCASCMDTTFWRDFRSSSSCIRTLLSSWCCFVSIFLTFFSLFKYWIKITLY